jgi:O-antigen/teichoic acid export membrane protein
MDLVTFLNPFIFLGLGEKQLIARKSFLVFLNMVAGGLLGYVAMFFILRYMGPEDYGIIGFGLAFVGLFAFITDLGFNRAHIKRISEGMDLDKCLGTFIVVKLVLISIMVGAVLLSIFSWKFIIGRGFETAEHEGILYIFLVYYAILSLIGIPITTFSARRETAKQILPGFLEPTIRVPLTLIVALGSFGVFALAGAYVLGVIASLIIALFLFRKYPIGKFDLKIFRSYYKFALPIAIASSVGIIITNIDKVMLQLFWGARFVGYYFTVQRLTGFLIIISSAITILLFPTLSKHHGKKEYNEIRKLTLSSERYISLIIIPCSIFIIIFSKSLLNLLNVEVAANAATTLRILVVYSTLYCFTAIFMSQIVAIDRPDIALKIALSGTIINICLNILFIPKDIQSLGIVLYGYGIEGAALATTITFIYSYIVCKYSIYKLTRTKSNPRIILHLLGGLIMGIILYFIDTSFNIIRWYEIGLMFICGIGIYLGFLYLIKEFKKDDFNLFINIINPREMMRYIFFELKGKKRKL